MTRSLTHLLKGFSLLDWDLHVLKHMEVPRDIWPVYRHIKLLFLQTVWMTITGHHCTLRNAYAGGRVYLTYGHLLRLKLSRQKWCKWTFLPSVDK